eukprot:4563910-Prymnesium_polylepis.1
MGFRCATGARRVRVTCGSGARHVRIGCVSRADRVRVTCGSGARHVRIGCASRARHVGCASGTCAPVADACPTPSSSPRCESMKAAFAAGIERRHLILPLVEISP